MQAHRSRIPSAAGAPGDTFQSKLERLEEIRRRRLELERSLSALAAPAAPAPAVSARPALAPAAAVLNAAPPSRIPAPAKRATALPLPALPPPKPVRLLFGKENVGAAQAVAPAPAEAAKPPAVPAPLPTAEPEQEAPVAPPADPAIPPFEPLLADVIEPAAEPDPEGTPSADSISEEPAILEPSSQTEEAEEVREPESPPQSPAPAVLTSPPKPLIPPAGPSGGGRANARARALQHEQTPYHSRSLRLRALAAAADPPQPKAKTASDKADEWAAATRKNTMANKGHHAKLIITLVHRDGPRPPSPSQALRERNLDFSALKLSQTEDDHGVHDGAPAADGKKRVRWTANAVIEPTPAKAHRPARKEPTAAENAAQRSCLRQAGVGADGAGAGADVPLSPPIVTVQRFIWLEPAAPVQVAPASAKRKKT
ncbi:hypothetical protein DFJ74DRAFT_732162 [Hyaloraphidium curvatum]|nr:hypothetical protein DFJ74DRAFT_732162 [Hyaloraphidium curvatum]